MVVEWNDEEIMEKLKDKIVSGLKAVGEFVEGETKVNIRNEKLVETGNLISSITHVVDEDEMSVQIGTSVEYAPFLELGTVKMEPKPFLRPALDENKDKIKRIFIDAK